VRVDRSAAKTDDPADWEDSNQRRKQNSTNATAATTAQKIASSPLFSRHPSHPRHPPSAAPLESLLSCRPSLELSPEELFLDEEEDLGAHLLLGELRSEDDLWVVVGV
jgi:hypothetical protein